MLSPSTPSRSASRTASTTTRCLLSPASDATWRCSPTDTDHLLASLNGLTIVHRTSIVRRTTYGVRVREGCHMITVESLTRRYAGFTAVDNVSFTAQPGRVTGFLGPNG